jgi:hemerythrin superfamily protein
MTVRGNGNQGKAQSATTLLRADHKLVSDLFADYEKTGSREKKRSIAQQICAELTVHAQIEEEIFYPAVKGALNDAELIPEATVEHASLKVLIAELEAEKADDEMFDAKVKVLSEYVKHHVKEEQNEIFPKARHTDLDMNELGARLAERKAELMTAQ